MQRLILPVLAILPVAAVSTYADVSPGANMIQNPGMEVDSDGDEWPDGWRMSRDVEYPSNWGVGGKQPSVDLDDTAHTGSHSLHYQAPTVSWPSVEINEWWNFQAWEKTRSEIPRGWGVPIISNTFKLVDERDWFLSMWVKAVGVQILHIKFIGTYDGEKWHWTQPLLRSPGGDSRVNGTFGWQQFKTELRVPGGMKQGRLEVWLWQNGQPCELWVDDVCAELIPLEGEIE